MTLILINLTGCGFHLTGMNIDSRTDVNKALMKKVFIEYPGDGIIIPYYFKSTLTNELTNNDINVTTTPKNANVIVKITNYSKNVIPLNIIGSYNTGSYEARVTLSYVVIDSSENILQNQITMKTSSNYTYNGAQQLSSNQLQKNSFKAGTERIAERVVNQLMTIQPTPATIIPKQ